MEPQYNSTAETMTPETKSSGNGALLGITVIILVLLLGGAYFWVTEYQGGKIVDSIIPTNSDLSAANDEPAAIESDLDSFDNAAFEAQLDADMKAIEAEF